MTKAERDRETRLEKAVMALSMMIDTLRSFGWKIDSPYDFENFFEDYGCHSNLFATGKFRCEEDE